MLDCASSRASKDAKPGSQRPPRSSRRPPGRAERRLFDIVNQNGPRAGGEPIDCTQGCNALEGDTATLSVSVGPLPDVYDQSVESATALLAEKGLSVAGTAEEFRDDTEQGQVVYIAERVGLMPRVDAWVVEHSLEMLARIRAEHDPEFELEVNLSGHSIGNPDIEQSIMTSLATHQVDPAALILEITETALVADADGALTTLTALRELGVGLSIDDFGTGYSSFTYLKRFPADELKIDRSFVAGLGTDLADTAIVGSCVRLAHAVGVRAVAEGVETPAQREALVELGCDLGQGHLLGRPAPAEHLPGMAAPDRLPAAGPAPTPQKTLSGS